MPSISAATMSSCAASWGLMVDALEAIGHSADHAGPADTVAPGIHDDRTRVLHEPFSMAQAIVDLKTKRGVHCQKLGDHRNSPRKDRCKFGGFSAAAQGRAIPAGHHLR